ncbi:M28 family peptidase [bacterium]|nr:M28 family peptidase [bacterium]
MVRFVVLLGCWLSLFAPTSVFLQAQEPPPLPEPAKVSLTASELPVFAATITPADVRSHVELLASDQFEGRSGQAAVRVARYLVSRFRESGLQPLFGESFYQTIPGPDREDGTKTFYGQNVGAWLPGSDEQLRDEFVIVSAHYDHLGERNGAIFRGADDNASGTSMLLEVASAFAKLKQRPRRSLVFVGFDLEEHMLWGSRWFVAHPPWPIERVKLFTTADMIGRSLGDLPISTVFVLGSEHGTGMTELLDRVGRPRGLNIARMGVDLIGTRSDYGPFRDRQIPFLFFSTGEHPDYHKPTDTADKIDYEQVARVSSLILNVTRETADADLGPQWITHVAPQVAEVQAVHSIARMLLEADEAATFGIGGAARSRELTGFQRFIVKQAEVTTRQILERGAVTPAERAALIRTAQVLLFSVF